MRECRKCAFRQASRKNGHLYICTRSTPPTVLHDEAGCDEYTENVKDLLWAAKHTDERIRAYASDVERYADMPGAYELRRELTDQINNLADQLVELRRTAIKVIQSVDQGMPRAVIEMRYLNCLSWDEIALELHYETAQLMRYQRIALEQAQHTLDQMKEDEKND